VRSYSLSSADKAAFVESCVVVRVGFVESWNAVVDVGVSFTHIHDSASGGVVGASR
jgi:hypothetical protein